LAEGIAQRGEKELLELLGHPDRRVRLEAQWELAGRGTNSFMDLASRVTENNPRYARLHAIWALRQIARDAPVSDLVEEFYALLPLVHDKDTEVTRAAIQMLVDARLINLDKELAALQTADQRNLQCTVGLGWAKLDPFRPARVKLGIVDKAIEALPLDFIQATKVQVAISKLTGAEVQASKRSLIDQLAAGDAFQRRAAVALLAERPSKFKSSGTLFGGHHLDYAATHRESSVRLLAIEALRLLATRKNILPNDYPFRQQPDPRATLPPAITNFLSDPDPRLIIAAGRAIHDVPIVEGFPALASFITKVDCPTNLYSRVIDACFRLGLPQHAQMLAGFAYRRDVPDWARMLALRALADWGKPPPLDRVNGLWRPVVSLKTAEDRKTGKRENGRTGEREDEAIRSSTVAGVRPFVTPMQPPALPPDLGRPIPYAEGIAVRRNEAPAKRAYLRVAGDLLFPDRPTETGVVLSGETPVSVQLAVIETAVKLRAKEAGAPLLEKFSDTHSPAEVRRAIVPALTALGSAQAGEAVKLALADKDAGVQASAVGHLDQLEGGDAVGVLLDIIGRAQGILADRTDASTNAELRLIQAAFAALGRRLATPQETASAGRDQDVPGAMTKALDALSGGRLALELELDIVAAAEASRDPTVKSRLESYLAKHASDSPESWRFALRGGNAAAGRRIFMEKPETQCSRCHQVGPDGGTVGPKLDGVGMRQTREYLLDSILHPNALIAAGFESVVIGLKDGTGVTGVVKRETADELVLSTPENAEVIVRRPEIQSRARGLSAMPEGLAGFLTKFELRDVIEFLASLK
jgi:putative heme-binding domain-containing protein